MEIYQANYRPVSAGFPEKTDMLYAAWLNAETLSAMTGTHAEITDIEMTPFKTGDGYIESVNLELESGKCILQRWRKRDFSGQDHRIQPLRSCLHQKVIEHG